MGRWRGRRLTGLAALALLAAAVAASVATAHGDGARWVVVRDASGAELARVVLPASNEFGLRYRNSVYQSLAEEHFRVSGDDLHLVALAAEELAVLEEYYTAVGGVRGGPGSTLRWSVAVARPPIAMPLRVQATALGERTLLTSTGEIPLWRLVAGREDTLVVLTVEEAG